MQTLRWLESDFLSLTDIKCDTGTSNPGDIDMCIVSKGANDPGIRIFWNFLFPWYEYSTGVSSLRHTHVISTGHFHTRENPLSRENPSLEHKSPIEIGHFNMSLGHNFVILKRDFNTNSSLLHRCATSEIRDVRKWSVEVTDSC